MNDLVSFLRARLDEDEAAMRYCSPAPWRSSPRGIYVDDANGKRLAHVLMTDDGQHIARHDPSRVLREVEVGRKILEAHGREGVASCRSCDPDGDEPYSSRGFYTCYTIRILAAVYSDHEDYRPEWKP